MRLSVNVDSSFQVRHRWLGAASLRPLLIDIFQAGNGMMLGFEHDSSVRGIGFNINSGRTLDVWFGRK